MRRFLPGAALALLLPALAQAQTPSLIVELEGGPVWQSYNDVEVPNDGSATRFALDELAGTGPWPAGRRERHGLRALVAPFSLTETAKPARPIRFAGADYAAGEPLEATYTFNSNRLTRRWPRPRRRRHAQAWLRRQPELDRLGGLPHARGGSGRAGGVCVRVAALPGGVGIVPVVGLTRDTAPW